MSGQVRVGVDLTAISEVAESIRTFGDRYVRRVFTDHEDSCSQGSDAVRASHLAGRFAAKEATLKVLRPAEDRPPWRSIEVVQDPSGACSIRLVGRAAEMAAAAGLQNLAVSFTHHADLACAVVVGQIGAHRGLRRKGPR